MLEQNVVIVHIEHSRAKNTEKIEAELTKNRLIQAIINDATMHDEKDEALYLGWKGFKDISFLEKYLEHYPSIKNVDLSHNTIGNAGCERMAHLLTKFRHIKKCSLKGNNIGSDGLQTICSALALHKKEGSQLEELDIEENPINDKSLKMLLAMLLNNNSILSIKYSLSEPKNLELMSKWKEYSHMRAEQIRKKLLVKHLPVVPTWQKIVFPIWLWKSLMHDKHEAFAFKYNTYILKAIESEIMEHIGKVLYINTAFYYFIVFFCPLFFMNECGLGLHMHTHVIYFLFAITSIMIEMLIVLWI